MRQFDAAPNPSRSTAHVAPYLVVLQSHHLADLDTVIVAPVLRDATRAIMPFEIQVEIAGEVLVLALTEIFSIDRSLLQRSVGNLRAYEDDLRRALDRLFTGF